MRLKDRIRISAHYRLRRFFIRINPSALVEDMWPSFSGHQIDWKHPLDLNEKIQWLICKSDTKEWTRLADKVKVRDFVKERGLADALPKLYGVWKDARDIDFDALPDKFVLKCNHDSGSCFIIDKSKPYDKEKVIKGLNACLGRGFGLDSCEPHYLGIPRRILAEEFLYSKADAKFSTSLIDYKVWCFNGKPYCIWAVYSRSKECLYCNVYDLDWNVHPEYSSFNSHYRDGHGKIPKPAKLAEMLKYASILSKGFPEVRVDFYIVDNKIYFGEMTFTSDCGRMRYFTPEYLVELGNQVDLSLSK